MDDGQQNKHISNVSERDRQAFRDAMSMFATGVTVVTAVDDEGEVRGVTVNSFTSISLEPPTVLVSLTHGRSLHAIEAGGRYGVSVLRHDQAGLSRHFSGREACSAPPEYRVREAVPTLAAALAWFECTVTRRIDVADHSLLIATVDHCGADVGTPLLYFEHHCRDLGLSRP